MRQTAGIWAAASLLALTATGVAMPTQAQNVSDLAGYSTLSVSPEFEKFLTENPNIKRRLQENDGLSQALLSDKSLQAQLLAGKATLFEIQRDLLRESATGSDAEDNNSGNQIQLKARGSARAQQNLNQAMAVLTGQQQATAAQEAAEVAEARQKALEELLEKLEEENTEALALFLANAELQQQIIDGAASIQDVMAELGVMVSEPQEDALAETTESVLENGTGSEPETESASNEPAPIDLNRIPSAAEAELDANGWPKYLNVPADCPAPEKNIEYIHEFRKGPNGMHTPLKADWTLEERMGLIQNYFRNSNWFYIMLREETPDRGNAAQQIAAPLITPNVEIPLGQHHIQPGNSGNTQMQLNISYCPGDFEHFTPQGENPIGAKSDRGFQQACTNLRGSTARVLRFEVRHPDTEANPPGVSTCVLEPKKRYFVNVRPHNVRKGTYTGGGIASALTAYSGRMHSIHTLPPYAGPCIDGPPFPPNYTGTINKSHPYHYNNSGPGCEPRVQSTKVDSCVRKYGRNDELTQPIGGYRATWKCYDPEDELPPQTFEYEISCDNNIRTKTWTKGYGEPAYAAYICEKHSGHEENYKLNTSGGQLCAAHRDGQIRKKSCSHTVYKNAEFVRTDQCQFDKQRNRYDWVMVNRSSPGEKFDSGTRCRTTYDETIPAHKNTCSFAGKEYEIGSIIKATCGGTATFICEQRADAPAHPRFVKQGGDMTMVSAFGTCQVETVRSP